MRKLANWRACVVFLALLALIAWAVERSPTFQICQDSQTYQDSHARSPSPAQAKESLDLADCTVLVADANHDLILAIGTILVAWFTGTLWLSAANQEKISRTHERAYIIWGGLHGVPKPDRASGIRQNEVLEKDWLRRDATNFEEPWTMMVHNFGKTPGFITEVRWGTHPDQSGFLQIVEGKKLSELIESRQLDTTVVPCEMIVSPTDNNSSWRYRYVQLSTRDVGHVMYGTIKYTDVFREAHYSTWAVVHDVHVTNSIGNFLSADWN